VRIEDGVDFLGQNLRKYNGKLLIKPTREAVKSLLGKLRAILQRYQRGPVGVMIRELNSVIRGWANYHRHVVSADTFSSIDTWLFHRLRRWVRRRHPKKNLQWLWRSSTGHWAKTDGLLRW
jgi:RNA-directed DNA polymerase